MRRAVDLAGRVAVEQAGTTPRRWFELLPQKREPRQVEQVEHGEWEAAKAVPSFVVSMTL